MCASGALLSRDLTYMNGDIRAGALHLYHLNNLLLTLASLLVVLLTLSAVF